MSEANGETRPEDRTAISMLREIRREIFSDHVLMVASGLGFHAMLAVLPALAAIAAVWQLLADPALLQ